MTTRQKLTTAAILAALVGFVYYVGSDAPIPASEQGRRRRRHRLAAA
jgi:hypothetical protein